MSLSCCSTVSLRVTDVMIACDFVECGYRIVELRDHCALVWGNIPAGVGNTLPADAVRTPSPDRGVTLHDTYGEAVAAYRRAADALRAANGAAANEMLAVLPG